MALWRRSINAKYGGDPNAFFPTNSTKPQGHGVSKGVLRSLDTVKENTSVDIRNGQTVSFWNDSWFGADALKPRFAKVYRLSRKKDLSVTNAVDIEGGIGGWNLGITKRLNGDEMGWITELIDYLSEPLVLKMKTINGSVNLQRERSSALNYSMIKLPIWDKLLRSLISLFGARTSHPK
ncbi:hypothetical protein BVC80_1697g26 [Macleaya cordata]|uniref:Reverse transcriptase zinc-binding domain n=1 Tax=Macleaya cordata TaxID=56857 RepID=A0A200PPD1_MACCD|nr:hypothetical protein BVC80_1697g26 [Macleaya cordata]